MYSAAATVETDFYVLLVRPENQPEAVTGQGHQAKGVNAELVCGECVPVWTYLSVLSVCECAYNSEYVEGCNHHTSEHCVYKQRRWV